MELNKTNKFKLPPTKVIVFVAATLVIALIGWGMTSYISAELEKAEQVSTTTSKGSNSANKETAYNGRDINESDPDAVTEYCESNKNLVGIKSGSAIVDTCVNEGVFNKWLKGMTDPEIETMFTESPECFSTA